MTTPEEPALSPDTTPNGIPSRMRIRTGVLLTLVGLLIFLLGSKPSLFGLDRSPVVGFVQIAVFLVGLGIICIGGYIGMMAFWKRGDRTIPAEIGPRLIATGYVVAFVSGLADVFGFGTQTLPQIPSFGRWQAMGVQIGEAIITIGFLLLIPLHRKKKVDEPKVEVQTGNQK